MKPAPDPHYRHRFPAEIISHAVWLYHAFSLRLRDVELLLAERGVVVSYESICQWCKKFDPTFASRLRRRRPQPGDKWHMDDVFIRIEGVQHYLWHAVDQEGIVLDILVQLRRDAKSAKRFFRLSDLAPSGSTNFGLGRGTQAAVRTARTIAVLRICRQRRAAAGTC